jgi:hypothetical protein
LAENEQILLKLKLFYLYAVDLDSSQI